MNDLPKNMYNKTLILILGFNRPNLLIALIKRIDIFKPEKIYISIDEPRKNNNTNNILIAKIKN